MLPLRNVGLPVELRDVIPERDPMVAQGLRVPAERWRSQLQRHGLPAPVGPLAGESTVISLSRSEVFAVADGEVNTSNAMQLLYHSSAWGLGTKAPRLKARLAGMTRDPLQHAELLRDAWRSVRNGMSPRDCYTVLLTHKGTARIPWFGAAFVTKYLYFAHGTSSEVRNVILDARVARALRPYAWEASPTTGWWADTYGTYCDLMARWSHEASDQLGVEVSPDQIEAALFAQGRRHG